MRKCVKPVLQMVHWPLGLIQSKANCFAPSSQLMANFKYILPRALSRTLPQHFKAVQGQMGTSAVTQRLLCENNCNQLLIGSHREKPCGDQAWFSSTVLLAVTLQLERCPSKRKYSSAPRQGVPACVPSVPCVQHPSCPGQETSRNLYIQL